MWDEIKEYFEKQGWIGPTFVYCALTAALLIGACFANEQAAWEVETPNGAFEITEADVEIAMEAYRVDATNYLIELAVREAFLQDVEVSTEEYETYRAAFMEDYYAQNGLVSVETLMGEAPDMKLLQRQIMVECKDAKYRRELRETFIPTEEELLKAYELSTDAFHYVTVNIAEFKSEESVEAFKQALVAGGEFEASVGDGVAFVYQMLPISDAVFGIDFASSEVGDFYTVQIEDVWYYIEVTEVNDTFEECKPYVYDCYVDSEVSLRMAEELAEFKAAVVVK